MTTTPELWQTQASQQVAAGPWLNVRLDSVLLPGGRTIGAYTVLELESWVNVLAVTPEEEIVFVRQYRHALGQISLEVPAGGCRDGEEPLAAAQRELLEETGYSRGEWREFMTIAPNPGLQNNWNHCFLATGVERVGDPTPDETEDLVVELHHRSTVPALITSDQIFHALTLVPLLAYLAQSDAQLAYEDEA